MHYKDEEQVNKYLIDAINHVKNNDELFGIFQRLLLDGELYTHSLNVAKLAIQLALVSDFEENAIRKISLGGLLHDIGKLEIPYEILYKPDKLTVEEFEVIKKHPSIGYNFLQQSGVSEDVCLMVLNHHEKVNGSGYPNGLTELRLCDEIITVADIFSALVENRIYHKARGVVQALDYISTFKDLNSNLLLKLNSLLKD